MGGVLFLFLSNPYKFFHSYILILKIHFCIYLKEYTINTAFTKVAAVTAELVLEMFKEERNLHDAMSYHEWMEKVARIGNPERDHGMFTSYRPPVENGHLKHWRSKLIKELNRKLSPWIKKNKEMAHTFNIPEVMASGMIKNTAGGPGFEMLCYLSDMACIYNALKRPDNSVRFLTPIKNRDDLVGLLKHGLMAPVEIDGIETKVPFAVVPEKGYAITVSNFQIKV